MEDRQARVGQATEAVNQAQIEHGGSLRLQDGGFQSKTAIAQAKSRLATAEAQLEAATLDLERTFIRAPFDGVVEQTLLNFTVMFGMLLGLGMLIDEGDRGGRIRRSQDGRRRGAEGRLRDRREADVLAGIGIHRRDPCRFPRAALLAGPVGQVHELSCP